MKPFAEIEREWKHDTITVDQTNDAATADLVLAGKTAVQVSVVANRYTVDCPYTMTLKKTYFDGTTAIESSEGTYYGVNMNEYTVQYSKAMPLTQAEEVIKRDVAEDEKKLQKTVRRKRGKKEGLKLWSSLNDKMRGVAKLETYGGCLGGCDNEKSDYKVSNMHTIDENYWQSEATLEQLNADPDKYARGFTLVFTNIVEIESFLIQIDNDHQEWYRDVTLSGGIQNQELILSSFQIYGRKKMTILIIFHDILFDIKSKN